MEQRSTRGMTSSNVKIGAKPPHGVVAVLKSLSPCRRAEAIHDILDVFDIVQSKWYRNSLIGVPKIVFANNFDNF